MSNGSFNFGTFIKESVDTIVRPKSYFASLQTEGGLGKPVIKALIYGVISGLLALLWSILNLTSVTGGFLGGAIGIMGFIWSVIGAIIGLFIGAVIVLIISAICGGNTKYEANVHVTASLMVLMPVGSFFGFVMGFSFSLHWLISIAINIFGLLLMYHALTGTLKAKESASKVVTWILVAIMVLFLVIGFFTKRAAGRFINKYGDETEQFFEGLGKDIEKAAKEVEEAVEDTAKEMEEALDSLENEVKE
ncbi:MAG TPA: Yip1 family protein [Bacteroidales bacterium]|nr:Yip1 family protein [Bacteroidales bacterium]